MRDWNLRFKPKLRLLNARVNCSPIHSTSFRNVGKSADEIKTLINLILLWYIRGGVAAFSSLVLSGGRFHNATEKKITGRWV